MPVFTDYISPVHHFFDIPEEECWMHHSQVALKADAALEDGSRNEHELYNTLQHRYPDGPRHPQPEVKHHIKRQDAKEDLRDGQIEGKEIWGHGAAWSTGY